MALDISSLKIGKKVHYKPPYSDDPSLIENGMIKEIPDFSVTEVRVVYKCSEDWKNFKNYTSVLTKLSDLREGWFFEEETYDDIEE